MKSAKKRCIESSSDDSCGEIPKVKQERGDTPKEKNRCSSRIKDQQKKKYVKPTRDLVWDKIPSSNQKFRPLHVISPPKRVNDMLRVHNRYNAEAVDIYDDDFINDDDSDFVTSTEELDSEEDERKKRRKKESKIKNRRRRLKCGSTSSSDNDDNVNKKTTSETSKDLKGADGEVNSQPNEDSDVLTATVPFEEEGQESDEDSQIFKSHLNSSRTYNVLKSDEEDECDDEKKGSDAKTEKEDDTSNRNKCSNATGIFMNNSEIIEIDSSSGSKGSSSESEDDLSHLSRSERQLNKKKNLFKNFKETQAKWKEKQVKSSSSNQK